MRLWEEKKKKNRPSDKWKEMLSWGRTERGREAPWKEEASRTHPLVLKTKASVNCCCSHPGGNMYLPRCSKWRYSSGDKNERSLHIYGEWMVGPLWLWPFDATVYNVCSWAFWMTEGGGMLMSQNLKRNLKSRIKHCADSKIIPAHKKKGKWP